MQPLTASLFAAAATNVRTLGSPSRNPCLIRVASSRFRHDPYKAKVFQPLVSVASPSSSICDGAASYRAMGMYQSPEASFAPLIVGSVHAASANPEVTFGDIPFVAGPVAARVPTPVPRAVSPAVSPAPTPSVAPVRRPLVGHVPTPSTCSFGSVTDSTNPDQLSDGMSTTAASHPTFVTVSFKHDTCAFRTSIPLCVGDEVVVEADRGEHLGVVSVVHDKRLAIPVPCKVLRKATADDLATIRRRRNNDTEVLKGTRRKVRSLELPMRIVDCEEQLDGNRITIFYAAREHVDFRKLQRALYKQHRCRIWLVNHVESSAHHRKRAAQ